MARACYPRIELGPGLGWQGQGHLPPAPGLTAFGAPAPHATVQVAPLAQVIEQLPVQVTAQVELAAQLTLALSPTVTLQLDFAAHSTLQDFPQLPEQVEVSPQ
jgi:hypothetical protein